MTEQEKITEWFIHEFWPNYPAKFCRSGKGSRQQALLSMIKHAPDEDERRRILGNLKAQVRADKGNQNRKWWCIGVTYVNNQMWEDEIEHPEELQKDIKICSHEGCHEDSLGDKFTKCPKHLEDHAERLKMMNILKEIGVAKPGQSLAELSAASREYLVQGAKSGKLFAKMLSLKDL